MTTPLSPAQKRYRRALRRFHQPHDLNSLIEARKALEAAERALEEERRKAVQAASPLTPEELRSITRKILLGPFDPQPPVNPSP